jgi:REP element-mobilizing transposase RayT
MARIARIVAPSIPHHITQRGNRRQETFFNDDDYLEYLNLISTWCRKYKVDIWAYCLIPNHIHLVADGLALYNRSFFALMRGSIKGRSIFYEKA